MMRTVFLFVNGIRTFPGKVENWTGRAVTATHIKTDWHAEKIEYLSSIISRKWWNRERAKMLATTMEYYRDWRIHLVGHSNGADVILDAMNELYDPRVESMHLIAPACEADFDKNGLNALDHRVKLLRIYIGTQDLALKWADTWGGKWLGYGALGKTGPKHCKRECEVVRRPWDHDDWFSEINFSRTLEEVWKSAK